MRRLAGALLLCFCKVSFAFSGSPGTHGGPEDISLSPGKSKSESISNILPKAYAEARHIRLTRGHEEALPLYAEILRRNPADRSAALHIACNTDSLTRQDVWTKRCVSTSELKGMADSLNSLLRKHDYTPSAIATAVLSEKGVENLGECSAPLYLPPLAAGSQMPPLPENGLSCLIQMFLLGLCVRSDQLQKFFSTDDLHLMEALGVAYGPRNENETVHDLFIPYMHIMPLEVGVDGSKQCVWLLTDLHPRILSRTNVGTDGDGAVMYIGPDSLALVQHLEKYPLPMKNNLEEQPMTVCDLGCGSGVQALVVSARCRQRRQKVDVSCVDINIRALSLTCFNFMLNELPVPRGVLGDLRRNETQAVLVALEGGKTALTKMTIPWEDLGRFNLVLSNPPFLPVPPIDKTIRMHRYGLFSSGGATGEELLERVVTLAHSLLDSAGSNLLAVVSEFMLKKCPDSGLAMSDGGLVDRITNWWLSKHIATDFSSGLSALKDLSGLLFINEYALDARVYAERRSDTLAEENIWRDHLQHENIDKVSPGLLFVSSVKGVIAEFECIRVPKTSKGSIWTPANTHSRSFIARYLNEKFPLKASTESSTH